MTHIPDKFSRWMFWRYIKNQIYWWFRINHQCHYAMVDMVTNKTDDDIGIPLVAWVFRCWCGKEIVELTGSGVDQIANGVPYDAVIGVGRYKVNRLTEGHSERIRSRP